MEEKMLVLDIDGTLTNSQKEISPATKRGIQMVLEHGHKVVLASGRPTPGMRRYEEELELEKYGGYLLSFNGARIINCRTGEIVYQRTLPLTIVPGLYAYARKRECGLLTYFGDSIVSAFEPDEYVQLESRINGMPIRQVENFTDYVDFDINKCLVTAPPEKAEQIEQELKEKYGDILSVYRSEPFFVEIMPKNVDKATSLDRMLESVGLTRENVICCGDGYNDITMIEYAGLGVAMGNAQPAVKEAADFITDTNDKDGLVRVIDTFIPLQESTLKKERYQDKTVKIDLPEKVKRILKIIQKAGFEAYVVGGCVRDSILGRKPEDWDITTSARPEQIKELFPRTIDTGIQHGTVTVMLEREGFEVTTYRIDGKYEDSRHPKEVTFTPSLVEDLKRRDFTINAMAYNEENGLIDVFGGLKDMDEQIIRCVGDAEARFTEDALRIMRAIRFAAQLGYTIEEKTKEAIGKLAQSLRSISAERVQAELVKLVTSIHPEYLGMAYQAGVTAVILPEFDRMMETRQNHPHHCYDVGEHTLHAMLETAPDKVLRLTMLFHDIGKPDTLQTDEKGVTHFYGHAAVGADKTKAILRRLRFDNDTIQKVSRLVLYHDYGNGVTPDKRIVRRAVHKIGEDIFPKLLEVRKADVLAQSEYNRKEKLEILAGWQQCYQEITAAEECLSLKKLAVTGTDLIALGMKPGAAIGETLNRLLEMVLEQPERNTREYLLAQVFQDKESETV